MKNRTYHVRQQASNEQLISDILTAIPIAKTQISQFLATKQPLSYDILLTRLLPALKENIHYKRDSDMLQVIQLPSALLRNKIGDCKSFTILVVALLTAIGRHAIVRFVSYQPDTIYTHVYAIDKLSGQAIDMTLSNIYAQLPYLRKVDYLITA